MVRQVVYRDITGGINNVNSIYDINSSTRLTESPDMVNIEYFKIGGIKSMDGNTQIGNTQSSTIVGGFDYIKGDNRYLIIATYNGEIRLYNSITNEFDLIYTFKSTSNRVSFVNMNNGIVATNGKDDLVFYEKGRHTQLSGTISTTQGSAIITGSNTLFTTELKAGDTIEIAGDVYFIASIGNNDGDLVDTIDNTQITLRTPVTTTNTNISYYLSEVSECNAKLINSDDSNISTNIRGLAIQYYNGRLWIGTDNGLFYSQIGMYNGWDIKYDAGVINSIYNDSSKIKGLGLYSDYMLVHKEFYTYIVTCTGEASTISVKPYCSISSDSQQSFITSNAKYFVYSKENMGIYPLTQITVFSDRYIGNEITDKVRNIFKDIRNGEEENIFAVSLPSKRWMIFYLPLVDKLGSNVGLVYDFQTKSFIKREVPQEVTIAFNYNNSVYIGTKDGKVLKEYVGKTFDGKPINFYWKSPCYDFANGYRQSFQEFQIDLAEDYNNNFYIRGYRDEQVVYNQRYISSDNPFEVALTFEGDETNEDNTTYWDDDDWVQSGLTQRRMMLPNNNFNVYQIELGGNTLEDSMAIYGFAFKGLRIEEAQY